LACAYRAEAHWQTAQAGARERAAAIYLRGLGHHLNADYRAAIDAFRDALDLYRVVSVESGDIVSALNSLAEAERFSDDLDAAERDYREALRVARAVGHIEGMASITGNLAALALDQEDWPRAERLAARPYLWPKRLGVRN
jgi:tetratricopeptide (TPR) repeat protein